MIPSPAFSLLSAGKTFQHPTHRPNELWQTDFTSLQVVGWGWDSLSTVLDDSSRDIVAWTLRTSMQASDVTETLDLARAKTGVDRVQIRHRPRLTCRAVGGHSGRPPGSLRPRRRLHLHAPRSNHFPHPLGHWILRP